ncbi:2Fe-2S iron-sulfur cluster-binding protein [Streptomyces fumanus]|uniref:2Fe-2S iron-sulfur cluster-binding protein n=1 Tax=Streptomyces fumanus TaxID=67302 RepID=UPI00340FA3B8
MSDDQHGQGVPEGGGRWDPLPQGDYDDGATAFVKLPEGGIDALLDSVDSPLAAPGHGYVPPPITVTPATTAGTDPAATGTWAMPSAPVDGAQWQAQGSGEQEPYGPGQDGGGEQPYGQQDQRFYGPQEHGGQQSYGGPEQGGQQSYGGPEQGGQQPYGEQPYGEQPYGEQPYGEQPYGEHGHGGQQPYGRHDQQPYGQQPYGRPDEAGRDDQFVYRPGATGHWDFSAAAAEEPAAPPAPGHDVTGQWSIPVAGGELPDESGEFTTSALVEQWGGTPPATLPGGAPAPWATQATGQPWGETPPAGDAPAGAPSEETGTEDAREGVEAPEGPAERPEPPAPAEESETAPEAAQGALTPAGDEAAAADEAESSAADESEPSAADGPDGEPVSGDAPEDAAPERAQPEEPEGTADPEAEAEAEAEAEGEGESAAETEAEGDPSEAPAAAAEVPAAETPAPEAPAEDTPAPEVVAAPHEEHPLASYVLRVNGTDRPVTDAWIGESLLYVLRERLGLAGAKDGCSQGECGACNVQVDGRLVASCLVPAATAASSEVRTVEGLAADGRPSDVQRALARCGAVQCGFCVPGMAMTVHDLLEGNPAPTALETRQALCGNLCRCSGYRGVLRAVEEVVAEREAHAAADAGEQDTGEARIPHQAGPGAGGVHPAAFESPSVFESPTAFEPPHPPGAPAGPQPPAPPAPHDQHDGQDGGHA